MTSTTTTAQPRPTLQAAIRDRKVATVVPSYITTARRGRYARTAYESFLAQVGDEHPIYVVDDTPPDADERRGWLERRRPLESPTSIYAAPGVRFTRGPGTGSAAAALLGVRLAIKDGARHVFLHLDDAVYNDVFPSILFHAADALDRDPELVYVRTGGYPLLSEWTKPRLGNRSLVRIDGDRISFDGMQLQPQRRPDYTLWWSHFTPHANEGGFWPLPLYHVLFPAARLQALLELGVRRGHKTLGEVETDYKDAALWSQSQHHLAGKFGYINFQFGGLEIHRTKIWSNIHRYANDPIL